MWGVGGGADASGGGRIEGILLGAAPSTTTPTGLCASRGAQMSQATCSPLHTHSPHTHTPFLPQTTPRPSATASSTVSATLSALPVCSFVLELVGAYAFIPHVALAESHMRRAPPQVAKASRTLIQGIRVASRGAWPCLSLLCRAGDAGRLGGTLGGGSPEVAVPAQCAGGACSPPTRARMGAAARNYAAARWILTSWCAPSLGFRCWRGGVRRPTRRHGPGAAMLALRSRPPDVADDSTRRAAPCL